MRLKSKNQGLMVFFLLVLTCILLNLCCMFSPFFHKIFEAKKESIMNH